MLRVLLLITCVACAACQSAAKDQADAPRPNIVLIMADDLGYGDLSCYGSTFIKTPHIDALAKNGIKFTDYHSNGAVCSPTRAALMTGRYPQRTGVEGVITAARHREVGLPLEEVTIAELLKDAGYATAMYGKWHLGYDIKRFGPQLQGFDTFEGFVSGNVDYFHKIDQEGHKDWYIGDRLEHVDGYVTDLINDRAVDWIARHSKQDKDQPFFLYLAHGAPHYPLQGPNDKGFREVGKKIREMPKDRKAAYKAMIESMDEGIGRVVAELERQGLTENTLVVFCSDNGQASAFGGSAGPLRGQKGTLYEGGHRVPMVMSGLGLNASTGADQTLAMGADFFPTFAALAGAKLPEGVKIDGIDLLSVLHMMPAYTARTLHWHFKDRWAVRAGSYKAVKERGGEVAFYNLSKDIGEANDLSGEHPELLREFVAEHERWLVETRQGVSEVSK